MSVKTLFLAMRDMRQLLAKAKASVAEAPSQGPWRPLPGQRLELGETGWQIHMLTQRLDGGGELVYYRAFTPEGNAYAHTLHDLDRLKSDCEEQARFRKEFTK